jgi:hypothetical protein
VVRVRRRFGANGDKRVRAEGEKRRSGRAADEQGGILLMSALLMTPLLVLSALVLDVGNAYQHRRQAQNAADAASMAATRELPKITNNADVVATAKAFALRNYGVTASQWVGCSDSGALPVRPDSTNSNTCISIDSAYTKVRVRLPNDEVPTAFAHIIGWDGLSVSAKAASVLKVRRPGGILPFGLPSISADANQVCLKTGPDGHSANEPPCDGASSGNFGWLDLYRYGDPNSGVPNDCTNGNANTRLATNIAVGADHGYTTYASGDGIRNDRLRCPIQNPPPNEVDNLTGNTTGVLDSGIANGLVVNGVTVPGRLADTPFQTRVVRSGSPALDDRPLWEFIDPTLTAPTIPASCRRATITSKTQMETCLTDYKAGGYTVALFTVDTNANDGQFDIQLSPRFGWVPQLWATTWDSGTSASYTLKSFRPVYIQTLYFKCTATSCEATFDPGEANAAIPVASNKAMEAATGFVIPDTTLPPDIRLESPNSPGQWEVLLTD